MKYPKNIKISVTPSNDIRFILKIETEYKISNSILVIMKNPSKANNIQPDKTVNNVIRFLQSKYKTIYIANLFPYYSSCAKNLKLIFKDKNHKNIMNQNIKHIKTVAAKVDNVLIGWGTNTIGIKKTEYDKIIKKVMSIINNKRLYFVNCCKCDNRTCKDSNFTSL